jgi:hypothetical protein
VTSLTPQPLYPLRNTPDSPIVGLLLLMFQENKDIKLRFNYSVVFQAVDHNQLTIAPV